MSKAWHESARLADIRDSLPAALEDLPHEWLEIVACELSSAYSLGVERGKQCVATAGLDPCKIYK